MAVKPSSSHTKLTGKSADGQRQRREESRRKARTIVASLQGLKHVVCVYRIACYLMASFLAVSGITIKIVAADCPVICATCTINCVLSEFL